MRLLPLIAIVAILWGAGALSAASPGDADCNGTVNPADSLTILQFLAALTDSVPCGDAADVNLNGSIDPSDALLILQFSAGLLNGLPPTTATPTPTRLSPSPTSTPTPTPTRISPPPTSTPTPAPTLTAVAAKAVVRDWILNEWEPPWSPIEGRIQVRGCTAAWLGTHWYVTCEGSVSFGSCILCSSAFRVTACLFEQTLLVVPC